jgi:thiamine kinase-like enzyme
MIIEPAPSVYLNRSAEFIEFKENTKKEIAEFLESYFKRPVREKFFPLFGGHSDAKNYFVEIEGIPYVLRVENPNVPLQSNLRELFSFEEAAKTGAAPKIYSISTDSSFVLVEYLNIPTLSLSDAKRNLPQLAEALSKIHAMPKNPYAKKNQIAESLEIYKEIKKSGASLRELDLAIEKLRELEAELRKFQVPAVTLHGDLHPRNLFLTQQGNVIAVDWEMTNVDDSFYDLSYCSLLHDFNEEEERIFVKAYKKGELSPEEKNRYALCKTGSLILLSLLCISQANELAKTGHSYFSTDSIPAGEWSDYLKGWSEKGEHEAQFGAKRLSRN